MEKTQLLARIQPVARTAYAQLMERADTYGPRHWRAKRLDLRVAQQLMELADGEKEWVGWALEAAIAWIEKPKTSPRAIFAITLAYERSVGGSPGHYGRATYSAIRIQRDLSQVYFASGVGRGSASTGVGD